MANKTGAANAPPLARKIKIFASKSNVKLFDSAKDLDEVKFFQKLPISFVLCGSGKRILLCCRIQ